VRFRHIEGSAVPSVREFGVAEPMARAVATALDVARRPIPESALMPPPGPGPTVGPAGIRILIRTLEKAEFLLPVEPLSHQPLPVADGPSATPSWSEQGVCECHHRRGAAVKCVRRPPPEGADALPARMPSLADFDPTTHLRPKGSSYAYFYVQIRG